MIVEAILFGLGYLMGQGKGKPNSPAKLPWPQEGAIPAKPAAAPAPAKPVDKVKQDAQKMEREMDPVAYDAQAILDAMNEGK